MLMVTITGILAVISVDNDEKNHSNATIARMPEVITAVMSNGNDQRSHDHKSDAKNDGRTD